MRSSTLSLKKRSRPLANRRMLLEQLENRQVMASDFLLEIDGIKGESSDAKYPDAIEINEFQWGASNGAVLPGGSQITDGTVEDFHFVTQLSSATPKLLQSSATGTHHKSAKLHVRNDDGQEYLTYELKDVLVSSVQHRSLNESIPTEEVSLQFDQIEQSYRPQLATGQLGAPIKTAWDVQQSGEERADGPHILPQHPSLNLDELDLFLKIEGLPGESTDNKHPNEIQIESFSWGLSQTGASASGGGGGAGKVQFQDFHFLSDASKASPLLAAAAAKGEHIKKAHFIIRKAGSDAEFLEVKLEDVLISSYQVHGINNTVPVDSFSLNFAEASFSFKPQNPDGSLGDPLQTSLLNTSSAVDEDLLDKGHDLIRQTVPTTDPGSQDYFLKIAGIKGDSVAEKFKNEIEIDSFSWGVSQTGTSSSGGGGGAGKVQFQDLHFISRTGVASPNLFAANFDGLHIPSTVLSIRRAGQSNAHFQWKLQDSLVTGYHTRSLGESVPTDQFSLNFNKIDFQYRTQKPDGSLATPVTSGLQATAGTQWVAGPNLYPYTEPAPTGIVDAFLKIDGITGDSTVANRKGTIELESFSWGSSQNRATANPNDLLWQNFTFVAQMGKASPQLANALVSNKRIPVVTLFVRQPGFNADYLKINLSNVILATHQARGLNNGQPLEEVSLKFGKLDFSARGESPALIGLLLPAVQKIREAAARVKFEEGPELLGLTQSNPGTINNLFLAIPGVRGGSTDPLHMGEIEVKSFGWGVSQNTASASGGGGGAGKVSMQDLHVVLNTSGLSADLFNSVITGRQWMNTTLSIRLANGSYIRLRADDVLVSSFNTVGQENTTPLDEITFNFGKITETFLARTTAGGLVSQNVATWDNWTTSGDYEKGPFILSHTTPSPAAVDYLLELEGVEGESSATGHEREIDIESFSFGASRAIDRSQKRAPGKVTLHDLKLVAPTSKASPALLLDLISGEHIRTGALSLRRAGQTTNFFKLELEDALITSYQNASRGDSVPTDSFSLNFTRIEAITPSRLPATNETITIGGNRTETVSNIDRVLNTL